MCRMITAPLGVPGRLVIDPFVQMAQGLNAVNEINTSYGKWVHGHGWGAVYEKNGHLKILRSVEACWDDPVLETLRDERIFLLHARKASQGAVVLDNTHPFDYEVDGAHWIYCHNGTVRDSLETPSTLQKTESTDSEKIFHLLLPYMRNNRVLSGLRSVYGEIRDFTCLNSFLLGPEAFWAVSLYAENPNYYALSLTKGPDGPIFSSEPLAEISGTRTIIPNGHAVYVDRSTGKINVISLGVRGTHTLSPDEL